jgi:hypothetical protein
VETLKKHFTPIFLSIKQANNPTFSKQARNYQVAVKVVNNEGIESFEIIKLKTNGSLEKIE